MLQRVWVDDLERAACLDGAAPRHCAMRSRPRRALPWDYRVVVVGTLPRPQREPPVSLGP